MSSVVPHWALSRWAAGLVQKWRRVILDGKDAAARLAVHLKIA
jgi:hypothetical protein